MKADPKEGSQIRAGRAGRRRRALYCERIGRSCRCAHASCCDGGLRHGEAANLSCHSAAKLAASSAATVGAPISAARSAGTTQARLNGP